MERLVPVMEENELQQTAVSFEGDDGGDKMSAVVASQEESVRLVSEQRDNVDEEEDYDYREDHDYSYGEEEEEDEEDFRARLQGALEDRDLDRVKEIVKDDDSMIRKRSPFFMALRLEFWDAVCYFIEVWPCGLLYQQEEGDDNIRDNDNTGDNTGEDSSNNSSNEEDYWETSWRNGCWEIGYYPLHAAAKYGAPIRVLKQMIGARPLHLKDLNILHLKDSKGRIPLMHALSLGRRRQEDELYEVIRLMVDAAPETLKVKDMAGELPLHYACIYCTLEVVQYVASKNMDAIRVKDKLGMLPLHELLFYCKYDRVENPIGSWPLHGALAYSDDGRVEWVIAIITFLVDSYPKSLSEPDGKGMLPIHIAVSRSHAAFRNTNHIYLIRQFLSMLRSYDPFSSCTRALRARNRDNGKTALHYAACHGGVDPEVFALLANECPESLLVRDRYGQLPLHLCRCPERARTALLLRPRAASVPDNNGNLPLHVAVDGDVARVLFDAYPEGLFAANNRGKMPIHVAVQRTLRYDAGLGVLKVLAERDPSFVQIRDKRGALPIFHALDGYDKPLFREVLDVLLERDPGYCLHFDGDTPAHHFAKVMPGNGHGRGAKYKRPWKQDEIMQLLLTSYPDCAVTFDRRGNLPLFYAAERGTLDTINLLVQYSVGMFSSMSSPEPRKDDDDERITTSTMPPRRVAGITAEGGAITAEGGAERPSLRRGLSLVNLVKSAATSRSPGGRMRRWLSAKKLVKK